MDDPNKFGLSFNDFVYATGFAVGVAISLKRSLAFVFFEFSLHRLVSLLVIFVTQYLFRFTRHLIPANTKTAPLKNHTQIGQRTLSSRVYELKDAFNV